MEREHLASNVSGNSECPMWVLDFNSMLEQTDEYKSKSFEFLTAFKAVS